MNESEQVHMMPQTRLKLIVLILSVCLKLFKTEPTENAMLDRLPTGFDMHISYITPYAYLYPLTYDLPTSIISLPRERIPSMGYPTEFAFLNIMQARSAAHRIYILLAPFQNL